MWGWNRVFEGVRLRSSLIGMIRVIKMLKGRKWGRIKSRFRFFLFLFGKIVEMKKRENFVLRVIRYMRLSFLWSSTWKML